MDATQAGAVYAEYPALGMTEMGMGHWLAAAARQLRENDDRDRKLAHIAASASVDQSTVWRFEHRGTYPRDLDKLIAAYAHDLDMEPLAIWEHAIELWRSNQLNDAEALERDEEQATPPGGGSGGARAPSARIRGRKDASR